MVFLLLVPLNMRANAGVPVQRAVALEKILADGALSTTIAKNFPLDEISAAHNMVEKATHMGNVVLDI